KELVRIPFGTVSRLIWEKEVQISGQGKICWGMIVSPQPKFIHTSIANICTVLSISFIPDANDSPLNLICNKVAFDLYLPRDNMHLFIQTVYCAPMLRHNVSILWVDYVTPAHR